MSDNENKRFRVPLTLILDIEAPTWRLAISRGNDIISQIGLAIEELVVQQGAEVINIPNATQADEIRDDLERTEGGRVQYFLDDPHGQIFFDLQHKRDTVRKQ